MLIGFVFMSLMVQKINYLVKKAQNILPMFDEVYAQIVNIDGGEGRPATGMNLYRLLGVTENGTAIAPVPAGSLADATATAVADFAQAWIRLVNSSVPDVDIGAAFQAIEALPEDLGTLHEGVQLIQDQIRTTNVNPAPNNTLEDQLQDVRVEANNLNTAVQNTLDIVHPAAAAAPTLDAKDTAISAALTASVVTGYRNAIDAATSPAYGGDATNDPLDDVLQYIVDNPPA